MKIKIDYLFLLYVTGAFLLGFLLEMIICLVIIILHELGHLMAMRICNWKVDEFRLSIFGGSIQYEEEANRDMYEEWFVVIAGPFVHTLIYSISIAMYPIYESDLIQMILFYNMIILIFNLLPIYPLDGGRMILLMFEHFLPIYYARKVVYMISICIVIMLGITLLIKQMIPLLFVLIILSFLHLNIKHLQYMMEHFTYDLFKRRNSNVNYKMVFKHVRNDRFEKLIKLIKRNKRTIFIVPVEGRHYLITENEVMDTYFNNK
ncbi:MAG TPA: site-2 protease family protein [Pseudogracilibacillus sp.]|nr:site-2 protease family protein [Pseudogracilibacillus sp.]